MKLGDIINAQTAILKLYEIELDGSRTFTIRKIVKALMDELTVFRDIQDDYIRKYGTDNQLNSEKHPDAFRAWAQKVAEMAKKDVDVKVKPILQVEDFAGVKIAVRDMQALINLGLMDVEEV